MTALHRTTIERLGHHGDGIAPGPIYAARTLPGEEIEGTLDGTRLSNVKILEPSGLRVAAPCSHYKSCGGCSLQHAADPFVADWKQGVVETALHSQGLETEFRPIITSAPRSRRRATFAGRRTKSGAIVGFHGRASQVVIDTPKCQLVHPDLLELRPALEALVVFGASRKGEVSLNVTHSEEGPDIAVTGGREVDMQAHVFLAELVQTHGISRLTWNGETIVTQNTPWVRFGKAAVPYPAASFLQATKDGEDALCGSVLEIVGASSTVADLFSGCGTFALPIAERASVHAVEAETEPLLALDAGWRMTSGLKPVTTEVRDLFRRPLLGDELKKFDAIVIDPPRAGAEAQMLEIAESDVPLVAAVSCNPATFARDAKNLVSKGFQLDWIQVVDQFRWSTHVELVAKLSRTR